MSLYQKLEGILKSYEKHISLAFLSLLLITVLGVGFPLMLLAEEAAPITINTSAPAPTPAPTTGPETPPAPSQPPTFGDQPPAMPQPPMPKIIGDMTGEEGTRNFEPPAGPEQKNFQSNQNFGNFGGEPGHRGPSQADQEKMQAMMQAQQLKMMQRGTKGIEQGLKIFERQIKRLTIKGIAIPSDVTDTLEKAKGIVAAMKNAQTVDEAQSAGMDDLPELMQTLSEKQQTLETLARWPQTLKQMDKTISQLRRSLKRDQTLAARAAKNGLDISGQVTKFSDGIAALQGVRDQANAAINSDPEQAFTLAQDSFFSQIDDVAQSDKIINYLGNIGNLPRTLKNASAQMGRKIAALKKHGEDTSAVEADLTDFKDKGAAVVAAVEASPLDEDALTGALDDLRQAQELLQNDLNDLMGDGAQSLPWEQGPKQLNFQPLSTGFIQKISPGRQPREQPREQSGFEGGPGGQGSFGEQPQFNQGF